MKTYLVYVDEPNRTALLNFFEENKVRVQKALGSKIKHQAWEGGYVDHVNETIEFAIDLFQMMNDKRPLPFTINDVVLVLYLHDIEKPFKSYAPFLSFKFPTEERSWHNADNFRHMIYRKYAFQLTQKHLNALTYIHGEGSKHNQDERVQNELAAFCHICDTASARIWYDFPKK